jgi:hypothetical protein
VIECRYEELWRFVTDLEHSVPAFDSTVTKVTVQSRVPKYGEAAVESVSMRAYAYRLPVPIPFRVRIEDGFCLMSGRARSYLVVMAAEPVDGGSRVRFLHMEAVPLPATGWLQGRLAAETRADWRNVSRLVSGA